MTQIDSLYATIQTAVFRAEEPLHLPVYKGSTFRGALGHAFKQVCCALKREHCDNCLVKQRCAYSVCFETPVPEESAIMRKYPSAPHPFVLEPPQEERQDVEPGEKMEVRLWLVGKAHEYLPYFIYAFDEMGRRGLGKDRGKALLCRVETVDCGTTKCLYTNEKQSIIGGAEKVDGVSIGKRADALRGKPLRICFETPTRIKSEKRLVRNCDMNVLAPALIRRLHTLAYFFCDMEWTQGIGDLLDLAATVKTLESHIRWSDWTRYSARQHTSMQMGGFTGEATYSAIPDSLLTYLLWGEALHVGKGSAFGLGKYRIMPAGS